VALPCGCSVPVAELLFLSAVGIAHVKRASPISVRVATHSSQMTLGRTCYTIPLKLLRYVASVVLHVSMHKPLTLAGRSHVGIRWGGEGLNPYLLPGPSVPPSPE